MVTKHPFTSQSVAKVFMDTIFKLHGLPESIVSDREAIFLSSFWYELFSIHGVQLHTSSAYHPQSAQTEVLNRCLETYLSCFCNDKTTDWPAPLHLPYLPGESASADVDNTLLNRKLKLQLLKYHLMRAQLRMKQQANSHRSERQFEVEKWIIRKVGSTPYTLLFLSLVKIRPTIHVSLLKKCYEVPAQISYPPIIDIASPHCPYPESILQRRMVKKGNKAVAHVLVKWSGLSADHPTWEYFTVLKKRFPTLVFVVKDLLQEEY
ncbi:uncharacterized protein LOC142181717 [Nicotiana tabacum]|uniref:Uncharacterized protein LOC142181717 n=1 Tax=Nicotiana tabacum TaxID=4097 RepID=A0AC58UP32_TOBAC